MIYWKLDEETIRCLINKDEISQMGFDLNGISHDSDLMSDFLNALVDESHKYIDWNTDNGIQNYAARALPADQFLITISCTYKDEAINQDLNQIRRMFQALNQLLQPERMQEIEQLSGEEKEKAFAELSKDLHDIFTGKKALEDKKEEKAESPDDFEIEMISQETEPSSAKTASSSEGAKTDTLPAQMLTFDTMASLLEFCSLLDSSYCFASQLYRYEERYFLLVDFKPEDDNVQVITFMITAEEFGAQVEAEDFHGYYLKEHGDLLIGQDAIKTLCSLA